jgi:ELWxxDGT repeat protein
MLGMADSARAVFSPSLVKDINSATQTSAATSYTDVGGTAFFVADDGIHGRELWVSNGTAGGTEMVKDIRPGSDNGIQHFSEELISFDGKLFFVATTSAEGPEVWVSDGTPGGTEILKDINPGPDFDPPHDFEVHGGELFFGADDGGGEGLWKTDGTEGGTEEVASVEVDDDLTSIGGMLLFGHHEPFAHELWKSDGTGVGTELVKVLGGGGVGGFEGFTSSGGEIFFAAGAPVGDNLYKTDGTAGGTEVVVEEVSIGEMADVGGTLLFAGADGGDSELWSSDGTTVGTDVLKDIDPAASSLPDTFNLVGSSLLFTADDGTNGRELWISDGTAVGTTMLEDIFPGPQSSDPAPSALVGGELFFGADDGTNGRELWKSDGTAPGTDLVEDLRTGSGDGLPLTQFLPGVGNIELMQFGAVGGRLFMNADDGFTGIEPWVSDGTAAGTSAIEDVNTQPAGSQPHDLTDVGGTLFFTAGEPSLGLEGWSSDGTGPGTGLIKDIVPGSGSGLPNDNVFLFDENQFTDVDGTLFFSAVDEEHGRELWISDGTVGGTELIKDINPGTDGSEPYDLIAVGDTLYFTADDGSSGRELWMSDGTPAGTDIVKDILPGGGGLVTGLTNVGGTVFFSATDGSGLELWKSDGTSGGTVPVTDPSKTGDPRNLTAVDGALFFVGGPSGGGSSGNRELWISDGTDAGTEQVADIKTDGSSSPALLTDVGGTLFFRALNDTPAFGLYSSEGTEETTTELTTAVDPGEIAALGDLAIFRAGGGPDGSEPWVSDGTPGGTEQLRDIASGAAGSGPASFTNVGGTVVFSADDGVNGRELWQTDGTALGTVAAGEIVSGASGGSPTGLTAVGSTLFFTADDGTTGSELWKAEDGAPDTTPPQTTIDAGPANGATIDDATPTFGFSSSEVGSSFECRVDGGGFSGCTSPEAIGPLTDGDHTFEVRARDLAGNVDPTPAARTFTVDTAGGGGGGGGGGGTTDPNPTPSPGVGAAPSNAYSVKGTKASKRGIVTLSVEVPGPGTLTGTATAKVPTALLAAKRRGRKRKITLAKKTLRPTAAGVVKLKLKARKRAKRALRRKRKLRASLRITYTPTGGTPRTQKRKVTFKLGKPKRRKRR